MFYYFWVFFASTWRPKIAQDRSNTDLDCLFFRILNAWNDCCSDTHQLVVTVEVVSSVGSLSTGTDPILERKADGWSVLHPEEAFSLDIFDLTGRQVHRVQGFAGEPVMLDPSVLPVVSLIRWSGEISGRQKTWRLAR